MNRKICAVYTALAIFASAAIGADNVSGGAQVNGIEIGKTDSKASDSARAPTHESCVNHCNAAESKCSSEVRRARAQCSRNAASSGRDPYTGRNDYTYFCRHFDNPSRVCGSDVYTGSCQARFAQRYGLCVDAMYNNIASMRYDCYKNERDAQDFCREELRDCKSTCK